MPKIQLFYAPGVFILRLKDGVYTRVHTLQNPCTADGIPVSRFWARHTDKNIYCPLITSPHIGRLDYGMPADYEIYTDDEIKTIDRKKD